MRNRWLIAITALGTTCFVACFAVAVALYPGGTWFDRRAPGHSFTKNFLCDLMQTHALNGEAAPVGSLFARIGTLAILVAFAAFFTLIARFESPPSRAGRVARGAALVGCVLGCAIPLVPSNLFRDAHVIVVVVAFLPGLVATIAAAIVCLRAPGVSRWIRGLAFLTLGSGGVDGLLYGLAYAQVYGFVPTFQRELISASLPLLQRVAMFALLAWIFAVCLRTIRQVRSEVVTRGRGRVGNGSDE